MNEIRKACEAYLNHIENDDEDADTDDYKQAIFEAAIEAVFGPDIWRRINIALSGGVKYWDGQ